MSTQIEIAQQKMVGYLFCLRIVRFHLSENQIHIYFFSFFFFKSYLLLTYNLILDYISIKLEHFIFTFTRKYRI